MASFARLDSRTTPAREKRAVWGPRRGRLSHTFDSTAERNKKSHSAKVVVAGLQEFKAHGDSNDIPGEQIEASQRALERAEAIVHAELKRGLGGLATIGSTAPFIGLLGTVVGILNAFKEISTQKATGLGAVAHVETRRRWW